jgi:isoleucyl-tRNA synthetase
VQLWLGVPGTWSAAVEEHRELIARETLAETVVIAPSTDQTLAVRVEKVLS